MLAVIIPTLNAQEDLRGLLAQLTDERVVVSDGGSADDTLSVALEHNVVLAVGVSGRGAQLARGADLAGAVDAVDRYLFLHADSRLPEGWRDIVQRADMRAAYYFRFGPRVGGMRGVWLRFIVGFRCWGWGLPYGDQGLLISRETYESMGGYDRTKPLFEDVDLVDRLCGVTQLCPLPARLLTDVSQHIEHGIWTRGWRNYKLLRAYRRGLSVAELRRTYLS